MSTEAICEILFYTFFCGPNVVHCYSVPVMVLIRVVELMLEGIVSFS